MLVYQRVFAPTNISLISLSSTMIFFPHESENYESGPDRGSEQAKNNTTWWFIPLTK